ncbi:Uncharacterized membrane protein YqaE, homolog of Blt101, UPF0057 family [Terribacillus halophilus]|uniref:Uncharacterized membrane protein YqaE, homolog of Blt101, UPF0057 family n=2 Tax=Terribacillus halophilus TaxID=361279 RepID=A0A1G6JQG6_9BACI|nr:Uncharacterized membrane protein YqaE, homolog of Blt101, UPF0057 family [Terribacillus halophilus]
MGISKVMQQREGILLAIFLPPVAVLFTGKPFKALLNLVLTLLFFVPGAVHAALVVKDHKDRKKQLLKKGVL